MDEFFAYPPEQRAIEAIMRFHAVKRWHMIDTTRQQTLAEHSANVAALAFYIAQTVPQGYFGLPQHIASGALFHDMGEVFSGDLPTPTKKYIGGLNELESRLLPDEFRIALNLQQKLMIKLCDIADGIRFIRLHGVDITSIKAREGLELQMVERRADAQETWPEHIYNKVVKDVMFYARELS